MGTFRSEHVYSGYTNVCKLRNKVLPVKLGKGTSVYCNSLLNAAYFICGGGGGGVSVWICVDYHFLDRQGLTFGNTLDFFLLKAKSPEVILPVLDILGRVTYWGVRDVLGSIASDANPEL